MRGELETEQTATYWPPVPLSLAALLSRSVGLLNWGSIALCWVPVLSTASYLQLTDSNWLNFLLHQVISLFDTHLLLVGVTSAPNSTHPQWRLYPDIFDWMHLLFTQVHFLFNSSAESQYVTLALCEIQTAKSRIWTFVTMTLSYDDNHYTMANHTQEREALLEKWIQTYKQHSINYTWMLEYILYKNVWVCSIL